MKFPLAAILIVSVFLVFGCQSAPERSSVPEPVLGLASESAARIYFYWDAPKKTPKSLSVEVNDKRMATAEEKEVLTLAMRPGEIHLKVGFAGFRQIGTPTAVATVNLKSGETRYFLFRAKIVPNVPIITSQGAYGMARDVFSLEEVDHTGFSHVAGTKIEPNKPLQPTPPSRGG